MERQEITHDYKPGERIMTPYGPATVVEPEMVECSLPFHSDLVDFELDKPVMHPGNNGSVFPVCDGACHKTKIYRL